MPANLHVDFTGDCSSLTSAVSNARNSIDSLDGRTAGVAVSLAGADAAVRGMNQVGQARENASGTVIIGTDHAAVTASRGEVQGLESDVRSLNRQLAGASAGAIMGVQDDGSIVKATAGVAQLERAFQSTIQTSSGLSSVEQQTSRVGASVQAMGGQAAQTGAQYEQMAGSVESSGARVATAMESGAVSMDKQAASASSLTQSIGSLGEAHSEIATSGDLVTASVGSTEAAMASQGKTAAAAAGQLNQYSSSLSNALGAGRSAGIGTSGGLSGSLGSTSSNSGLNAAVNGVPVSGIGPPPGGPPGGGGGGGGGGGIGPIAPKPPARPYGGGSGYDDTQFFSGMGDLAGPAAMGSMLGIGVTALYAAAGAASVVEAVTHIPSAMSAATAATGQFNTGLNQAVAGAHISTGVFSDLGSSLHGLGAEVGTVGLQNMNTAVEDGAKLASTATTSLQNMAPAIGPALNGITSLADAVMTGLSSPQAVAAVKGISDNLSNPANEQGISNITSGLVSISGIATQAVTDVAGMFGGITGGATMPVMAGGAAAVIAGMKTSPSAPAGTATRNAGVAGVTIGLASAIEGSEQKQGMDTGPSTIAGLSGFGLAKAFGASTPLAAGIGLAGVALPGLIQQAIPGQAGKTGAGIFSDVVSGAEAGALLGAPFEGIGAIPGAAIGAVGALGYDAYKVATGSNQQQAPTTPAGQFPTSIPAAGAPMGWNADAQGNLTPATSALGGGGYTAGMNAPTGAYTPGQFQGAPPPPPPPPPSPGGSRFGSEIGGTGPGASVGSIPAQTQASLGLSSANNAAASSYNAIGQSASSSTTGMAQTTQHLNDQSSAMSNLNQNASNAQPAVQQATQQSQAAAKAATATTSAVQQSTAAVAQVAPAATAAVTSANQQVSTAGASVGATAVQGMASGVTSNTSAACDASAKLASSTANCAASTLQTASPSKVFQKLGESTGDGMALGIRGSMTGATNAVRGAMSDVVGAGAHGLDAHSPSQEFMDLGTSVPQGLQLGIMRNSDGTISAVTNLTNDMQSAHEDAWNPSPATLPNPENPMYRAPQPQPAADDMNTLNQELGQQNAAAMPPALMPSYATTNTGSSSPSSSTPTAASTLTGLQLAQQMAVGKGWNANTIANVAAYMQTKQDIQSKNNTTEQLQQSGAMNAVGMNIDPNSKLTSMQQYKQNQMNQHLGDQSIASQAVQQGLTPQQVKDSLNNAGMGMGPSTAAPGTKLDGTMMGADVMASANRPGPASSGPASGFDPGTKSTGFGDPSRGSNAAGVNANTGTGVPGAGGADAGSPAAKDAGGNFASSFGQGIEKAATTAFNSATNLAAGAVTAVTTALGIKSPSRVMMGHGEMTAEGFAHGIRDSNGPYRAMRQMVRDAIDGGRDEWGRGWWNDWGMGGPGGSSGGGGGSSGGGGGSGGGSGLGGPWGWSHGLGGWGHHHGGWGRHHGDHDDHHGGHGDHDGHGHDDHHGWGDDTDRMAERFADRLGDRLGGGRGGGGGGGGGGHGWGHDDHGGWGGGWGHDGDHMGWMFGAGGMGGSGGSGSGGGGNPPYTGYNPWWAEHPYGRGGHGHGDHDDHGGHHDRDHDRHDDHHRGNDRDHDRHNRGDDHMHMPGLDHLSADNMPEIANQSHQMGQSVAQGMAQGMQQQQSSVTEAAAMMAVSAVATVRSQLGIASPSKVFYEIGGDAVKGFSHGLQSGVSVIAENSASLSQIASEQMAQGMATGQVNQGYSIGLNRWLDGLKVQSNWMPFSDWEFDMSQLGGLGSGVQKALDGTESIAQSSGLQVGNVWARNMVTGVDSVLQTSLFSALSSPAVGSALAETALGVAGQLGPAGSGAEYYNTASGSAGLVSMGANASQPITITQHTYLDGQIIDTKISHAIASNNNDLTNLIMGARG